MQLLLFNGHNGITEIEGLHALNTSFLESIK